MVRVKRPLPKEDADEPAAKTTKLQVARRKCKRGSLLLPSNANILLFV